MPVAAAIVAGSTIAAGGAIIGGSMAAGASQQATDTTTALQREIYNQNRTDNAPYLATGTNALSALSGRLGVSAPAGNVTDMVRGPDGVWRAAPSGGRPSNSAALQGYLQAYPDVAAEARRVVATGEYPSEEAYAAAHYQKYGQAEGRVMPTTEAAPATSQPAAAPPGTIDPNQNDLTTLLTQINAARPAEAPRPTAPARTELTRPTVAPLDVSTGSYQQSPDYQFQLSEGNKNILANKSAFGQLESGSAMKAVQKYGQDVALGDYAQWRDYATGNYRFDVNRSDNNFAYDQSRLDNNYTQDTGRADSNFNIDRGYRTDVYNYDQNTGLNLYGQKTNDLFKLAGMGQGAVAQSASSGQNYANTTSNAIFSNAAAQGNAALNTGGAIGAAANNGVNAYTQYLGRQSVASAVGASGTKGLY